MAAVNDDGISQEESDRLIAAELRWKADHRRAADERWDGHLREHQTHLLAHHEEHIHEKEETRLHEEAIETANGAHGKEHKAQKESIRTALAAVDRLADVHAEAHKREHLAHEVRHIDQEKAVDKAADAVDKRLSGMNEVRDQLREQARVFASTERVDGMQKALDIRFADTTKHTDERYEENRRRIELLEKGDTAQISKAEGRTMGQGAVVAIIVGAVSFVATLLGILIVISNIATGA